MIFISTETFMEPFMIHLLPQEQPLNAFHSYSSVTSGMYTLDVSHGSFNEKQVLLDGSA